MKAPSAAAQRGDPADDRRHRRRRRGVGLHERLQHADQVLELRRVPSQRQLGGPALAQVAHQPDEGGGMSLRQCRERQLDRERRAVAVQRLELEPLTRQASAATDCA
jgi:hypothetical protein